MQVGNAKKTRGWQKFISENYRCGKREQRAQRGVCDATGACFTTHVSYQLSSECDRWEPAVCQRCTQRAQWFVIADAILFRKRERERDRLKILKHFYWNFSEKFDCYLNFLQRWTIVKRFFFIEMEIKILRELLIINFIKIIYNLRRTTCTFLYFYCYFLHSIVRT